MKPDEAVGLFIIAILIGGQIILVNFGLLFGLIWWIKEYRKNKENTLPFSGFKGFNGKEDGTDKNLTG